MIAMTPGRFRWVALVAVVSVAGLVVAALAAGPPGGGVDVFEWEPPEGIPPAQPSCDRVLGPDSDLQAEIARGPDGAILCLQAGSYAGPLRIERPVTLWGPRDAVIRTSGRGTTVDVVADGAALLGFSVSGSGGRYDVNDAAVRVSAADVRVEGLFIEDALFGILAESATRLAVRGNEILGDRNESVGIGMRGDAIRFWSTTDSLLEGNHVTWGRDVVMWYSARVEVVDNLVSHGRYGAHFMYSHDSVVRGNRFLSNVVGVFIMYTHGIRLEGNLIAGHSGPGGLGLGLKDAGDLRVRGNEILDNRVGIHLDTSPSNREHLNRFEGNTLRLNEMAVVFNGGQPRNVFSANSFRNNHGQVRVDGGGHAREAEWQGNHFDDYRGYDLDADGYGDRPYELRRLSSQLTGRRPQLAFLRGTPALWLVDVASQVSPLLRPETILVDEQPRMSGPDISREGGSHAH